MAFSVAVVLVIIPNELKQSVWKHVRREKQNVLKFVWNFKRLLLVFEDTLSKPCSLIRSLWIYKHEYLFQFQIFICTSSRKISIKGLILLCYQNASQLLYQTWATKNSYYKHVRFELRRSRITCLYQQIKPKQLVNSKAYTYFDLIQ